MFLVKNQIKVCIEYAVLKVINGDAYQPHLKTTKQPLNGVIEVRGGVSQVSFPRKITYSIQVCNFHGHDNLLVFIEQVKCMVF